MDAQETCEVVTDLLKRLQQRRSAGNYLRSQTANVFCLLPCVKCTKAVSRRGSAFRTLASSVLKNLAVIQRPAKAAQFQVEMGEGSPSLGEDAQG